MSNHMSYSQKIISLFEIVSSLRKKNKQFYIVFRNNHPYKIYHALNYITAIRSAIINIFGGGKNIKLMREIITTPLSRLELIRKPDSFFLDCANILNVTCKEYSHDLLIKYDIDTIKRIFGNVSKDKDKRSLLEEILNMRQNKEFAPYQLTLFSPGKSPTRETSPYFTTNPRMS